MTNKRVLITGIYGQDGSYLSELLLEKGYEVHGIERDPMTTHAKVICEYLKKKRISSLQTHKCNLNSYAQVRKLIRKVQPDECYHLAATHFSSELSDKNRKSTDREIFYNNVLSALNLISSINDVSPHTRFVAAGSCLMFEGSTQSPQNERTPYLASSMYGLSKIAVRNILDYFRRSYNLHLSISILYNHESPRRQDTFVSKKIVSNLVKVKRNEISEFSVGNLNAVRDWGYAKDYVYGMWLMAQRGAPKDYILATGRLHAVKDLLDSAAAKLGVDLEGVIRPDKRLINALPKTILLGDPSLARAELKWDSTVDFEGLVELMINHELNNTLD
jgi:GDPmannose 4,6-dehydratase